MQDLGLRPPSPKPALTISHGGPIHGQVFLKNIALFKDTILEIHHTLILRICRIQHLSRHPGLQSIPLDAHRNVCMVCPSFRRNFGKRAELYPKTFERLLNQGRLWTPCPHPGVSDMPPSERTSMWHPPSPRALRSRRCFLPDEHTPSFESVQVHCLFPKQLLAGRLPVVGHWPTFVHRRGKR